MGREKEDTLLTEKQRFKMTKTYHFKKCKPEKDRGTSLYLWFSCSPVMSYPQGVRKWPMPQMLFTIKSVLLNHFFLDPAYKGYHTIFLFFCLTL